MNGHLLTTTALLLLFGAAPDAQERQLPPLVEKVNVSVINVDVTVIDHNGTPVASLTPGDFEVLEDGKPQKITNFYVVDHANIREEIASVTPAATARFRRKAVLLVDNHFVDKRSRDVALREVRKFIASDYAGEYDWSIAMIAGGVHVLQPFTSDKATLNAVLDRILSHGTAAPVAPLDGGSVPTSRGPSTGSMQEWSAERLNQIVDFERDVRFSSSITAMKASAAAVIDACRAYSSVDGKKLIVLVTGAMEMENRFPDARKQTFLPPEDSERQASQIREAMVREANASNFNIYVLNAAGTTSPVSGYDVGDRNPVDSVRGEVRNLDTFASGLASQTGGMYLTSNTFAESIRKIDSVSSTFYSIGYMPSHFEDGKYHAIKVRLKKPGYDVFNRSGYLDSSSEQRLEDSLKVEVASTLPGGPLPVHVDVGQKVQKGQSFSVPVTVALPIRLITLLKRGEVSVGRVHIYLSVFDQSDTNIAFQHSVQSITLSEAQTRQLATTPESNFRYGMKVELKPGTYRIVVAIRDELTDEVGRASTTIDTRG